jgi:hypothetical protein
MKPPIRRKLTLGTETLKLLSRAELGDARGGLAGAANAVTKGQLSWCTCVPPE